MYRKRASRPFFVFEIQHEAQTDPMTGKATEISTLLAPTVAALGLELLGVEFAPTGNSAMLRLYIDAPGRLVDIEDCTRDPTRPENVEREDGRGLFLMRSLMDTVERYDEDGNVVRLTLNRR